MKNLTKALGIIGLVGASFLPGDAYSQKLEKYNKKGQITKEIDKVDRNNDGIIEEIWINKYKYKRDGRIKVISKNYSPEPSCSDCLFGKSNYLAIYKHIEDGNNKMVSDYSKTEGDKEYSGTLHPATSKFMKGRTVIGYLGLSLGILRYDKYFRNKK